ncbi:uncharacterized protein LOC125313676 [Rhodamnia argentea]|uniref:Uncharacterized protein LOC125313676 n=1 Tax=Rhodamnia argentea TaxID=178133 RepID=A0ABM3GYL1_9MYRT|nr:uncharacterized protein LOC125313676 [Rhodamnia argentea]
MASLVATLLVVLASLSLPTEAAEELGIIRPLPPIYLPPLWWPWLRPPPPPPILTTSSDTSTSHASSTTAAPKSPPPPTPPHPTPPPPPPPPSHHLLQHHHPTRLLRHRPRQSHHLLRHLHHPHLLRRRHLHHPHLLHPRHLHHLGTLLLLLPRHLHRLIGLPYRCLRLIGLHHHHPPGSDLLLLLGVETTRECTCFITRKDMGAINIKNKGTLRVPGERIAPNKTLSKIKKKTSIVIT